MTKTRLPRIEWTTAPGVAHCFPMAAVVRMPDGPALATVVLVGSGANRSFLGRIAERDVTGLMQSAAAARREVALVVQRAHQAAERRRAAHAG